MLFITEPCNAGIRDWLRGSSTIQVAYEDDQEHCKHERVSDGFIIIDASDKVLQKQLSHRRRMRLFKGFGWYLVLCHRKKQSEEKSNERIERIERIEHGCVQSTNDDGDAALHERMRPSVAPQFAPPVSSETNMTAMMLDRLDIFGGWFEKQCVHASNIMDSWGDHIVREGVRLKNHAVEALKDIEALLDSECPESEKEE